LLLLASGVDAVGAQQQADPLVPEDELIRIRAAPIATPPDGARLFVANCATCHDNHKVDQLSRDVYRRVITNGVRRGNDGSIVVMPSFAPLLSDEEITTLVNYLVDRVGETSAPSASE
jgi:mono/diheme cytochrome c family protein